MEASPDSRVIIYADVPPPPAPKQPDKPADVVGVNGECPALQVFTDAEDLCERGILPIHPYGSCERLPAPGDESDVETRAARTRVAGLGGSAELFVKSYTGSGGSGNETVFLALRGANGYVLLDSVADYSSQGNDTPEFERFVGDATSVEVRTSQEWFIEPDFETRRETTRCTLDEDGSIRCDGACPDLALAKPLAPLDCPALAGFDWSTLPRGEDELDDWAGMPMEYTQRDIAMTHLGIADAEWDEPHGVRTVDLPRSELTILEPTAGRWVLLHGLVPLVSSTREIRVGHAPGGLFVSSWSGDERRIHRLNMATHELEPVFPGRCGSAPA